MAGKTNADTTKMSPEEVDKLGLQGSKRPPGQNPGGVLHQRSGMTLQKAGAYPVGLAALIVIGGVSAWAYYHRDQPHEPKLPRDAKTH